MAFDHYDSTNSAANRALTEQIYARLDAGGHIARRSVAQFFDPAKGMFLPDRYIKGTCPNCKAADQYGDNCEVCGATYGPTDLIDPKSVVSGATPELRDSEHYFFEVGRFEAFLREWLASDTMLPGVKAKLMEWLDAEGGLRAWDISRDAPYFGFEIPNAPGKYFYVWLDAPIGYLSSFQNLCAKAGIDFDAFLAARQQGRVAPLHRQGHRQFPRPVLACSAARGRHARAHPPARQRLPDRGRRQDDASRAAPSSWRAPISTPGWIRKRCAITSRRSPRAASTTST